jgi:ankyrin repeat protein
MARRMARRMPPLASALAVALLLLAIAPAAQAQAAPQAFFNAVARDDDADTRVYLLRGASAAAQDRNGTPALVLAAAERSFKVVRTFLDIPGTEVDLANRAGETALMYAALHGSLETVQLLIDKGAQVNRQGWTPLHYAATNGSLPVVRLLLEHHAYIDAESPNRSTPLMMAVRQRHEVLAKELVDAGADPTVRNDAGLTAADYAERGDNPTLARWIREKATEFAARYRAAGTVRR